MSRQTVQELRKTDTALAKDGFKLFVSRNERLARYIRTKRLLKNEPVEI
jgi:hypothetical protein